MDSLTNTDPVDDTTIIVDNVPASNVPWSEHGTPVLNISVCDKTKDHKFEQKTKKKKKSKNVQQLQPPSVIDYNTFPLILSRILTKCDVQLPVLNLSGKDQSYLGLFGYRNKVTRTQIFHMFCTNADELYDRFNRANQLYVNNKDLMFLNRTFIHTICARSLYRRAEAHFPEFKWNKQGNSFEVPIASEDKWIVIDKFRELNRIEMKRVFNFLKFLHNSKK